MTNLLPCPFCGGVAIMRGAPPRSAPEQWVECTQCKATSDTSSGVDRATDKWNRRIPAVAQTETDLAAENKKLQYALRTIVSEYGPNHGSRYCFRIAVDVLKEVAAARTSMVPSTHCRTSGDQT